MSGQYIFKMMTFIEKIKIVSHFALLLIALATVACSARNVSESFSTQDEQGVLIGGVRWATRNVAQPGTFVAHPENFGMLYQWNRIQYWTTAGEVTRWNSSVPGGAIWETTTNPCPAGWRVPTQAEWTALRNAGAVWTMHNGVYGRMFGTAPNQIFLPAAGFRNSSGALNSIGTDGYYWSSTPVGGGNAWAMWFNSRYYSMGSNFRGYGFSVRCVAN